jgi:hypothetical protein
MVWRKAEKTCVVSATYGNQTQTSDILILIDIMAKSYLTLEKNNIITLKLDSTL